MSAILLTGDLMASSRIQASAAASGAELLVVATEAHLIEKAAEAAAQLVLLDLGMAGLPVTNVVNNLKQLPTPPDRIVAFGPHVQRDVLKAAEEAGCDDVLARGKFLDGMAEFFRSQ